jgi:hypothetical protein
MRRIGMAGAGMCLGRGHEAVENGARMRGVAVAAAAQGQQLALERTKRRQPLLHTADVLVEQRVDLGTRLLRRRGEFKQVADLGQRDVQRPAVADELQARKVPLRITPVARLFARRLFEQAFALLEPYRLHVAPRLGGQFTNPHRTAPEA